MKSGLATAAGILAGSLLTCSQAPGQERQPEGPAVAGEPQLAVPEGYDVPPKPLRIKRPKYPKAAFTAHIEGTVVVEILIDSKGSVVRARVVQSVPALDAAAVECALKCKFRPAQKSGKPVTALAHLPVQFRIY